MTENGATDSADDEPRSVELCAQCGASIDTSEWHSVLAGSDATGDFQLYPFCDDDCRDQWKVSMDR